MKGLIVSSGKIQDLNLLESLVDENDFIICADGGLDYLRRIGKIPNLAIGDFDSISKEGLDFIRDKKIPIEKFPKMKDETDTELAIISLINRGINDITLIGVTGSRMDHTIGNVFLLRDLKMKGINGKIVDDNNTIYFENDFLKLEQTDDYVSILPLTREGADISLTGFLYPLDKKHIKFGATIGISNEIKDEFGTIEVHKGELLVFISKD